MAEDNLHHAPNTNLKLPVADTKVRIEGAGERYIQQGSILAVTCIAEHPSGRGPQAVVWYRGAARLDYDAPRGGIALQVRWNRC